MIWVLVGGLAATALLVKYLSQAHEDDEPEYDTCEACGGDQFRVVCADCGKELPDDDDGR